VPTLNFFFFGYAFAFSYLFPLRFPAFPRPFSVPKKVWTWTPVPLLVAYRLVFFAPLLRFRFFPTLLGVPSFVTISLLRCPLCSLKKDPCIARFCSLCSQSSAFVLMGFSGLQESSTTFGLCVIRCGSRASVPWRMRFNVFFSPSAIVSLRCSLLSLLACLKPWFFQWPLQTFYFPPQDSSMVSLSKNRWIHGFCFVPSCAP